MATPPSPPPSPHDLQAAYYGPAARGWPHTPHPLPPSPHDLQAAYYGPAARGWPHPPHPLPLHMTYRQHTMDQQQGDGHTPLTPPPSPHDLQAAYYGPAARGWPHTPHPFPPPHMTYRQHTMDQQQGDGHTPLTPPPSSPHDLQAACYGPATRGWPHTPHPPSSLPT